MYKCEQARQHEHAKQHERINGKWVGYWCGIKDVSRVENSNEVKSAGSAGKTRGVLRFDFLELVAVSCQPRIIYLSGATNLLGPGLDESAPAGLSMNWSFTDHHFFQLLTSGPSSESRKRLESGFCWCESSESVPPGPGP